MPTRTTRLQLAQITRQLCSLLHLTGFKLHLRCGYMLLPAVCRLFNGLSSCHFQTKSVVKLIERRCKTTMHRPQERSVVSILQQFSVLAGLQLTMAGIDLRFVEMTPNASLINPLIIIQAWCCDEVGISAFS